jgi:site-specific recombinase XerD
MVAQSRSSVSSTQQDSEYVAVLESFALALKVEGLRPHTISSYVRDARRLGEHAAWHPIAKLDAGHVRSYIDWLSNRVAPKTVAEAQFGLRRFFRFLVGEGEIAADPTVEIKLVKYRVSPQPTYTPDEVHELIRSCDSSSANGIRDRAIITVLFDAGLRVGELVSMGLPDWDSKTVKVDGKTGIRTVPLGDTALLAVQRYVRKWKIADGSLWRGNKGRITESGIFQMVRRRANTANVEFKGVHAFRRAAAAQMKRLGMNDSDILEVMGWTDVTMLRRYTATVANELAQKAHDQYSPADSLR